jgi:hypothetical protein
MAVLAFACALMIEPPSQVRRAEGSEAEDQLPYGIAGAAPLSRPALPVPHPSLQPGPGQGPLQGAWPGAAPRPARQRWGKDIEWPEAWRAKPKPGRPDET